MKQFPQTALAIETSCDETAFAYFVVEEEHVRLVSHTLYSQAEDHSSFGGVVPHMAARLHHKKIPQVFEDLILDIENKGEQFVPEAIFVTDGPGLSPSLWTGVNQAKILGKALNIPVYGVNHMHGHLLSGLFEKDSNTFPLNVDIVDSLGILISGGHTDFMKVEDYGKYAWIGGTQDDAVGEAFDKVAKMLGLGYPGGPVVSKRALEGNPEAFDFPLPMRYSKDLMMSYSGLKTAVLYTIQRYQENSDDLEESFIDDICASFQKAAIGVLIHKIEFAVKEYSPYRLMIGGGVIANPYLQNQLDLISERYGLEVIKARGVLTSDNAIMIGMAGLLHLYHGVELEFPTVNPGLASEDL